MFFVLFFIIGAALMIGTLAECRIHRKQLEIESKQSDGAVNLYTVTYMRHITQCQDEFAAHHLAPPLFRFKKVIWDVETEKYSSVKESLMLILTHGKWNIEFIEAFI